MLQDGFTESQKVIKMVRDDLDHNGQVPALAVMGCNVAETDHALEGLSQVRVDAAQDHRQHPPPCFFFARKHMKYINFQPEEMLQSGL